MEVTAAHTNRHGNVHDGLIATVLETAMRATASLQRGVGESPVLTLSMTVNFSAPMR